METPTYRLVLVDPVTAQLFTMPNSVGPQLPEQSIAAGSRVAQALTQQIALKFGLRTLQLAILPRRGNKPQCAVHEILWEECRISRATTLTKLNDIPESELDSEERRMIGCILRGDSCGLGRFARLGWISDLLARTPAHLARDCRRTIRQSNQGINFCLLTFRDANGKALWFKAVGEPNLHEYPLTVLLTDTFPQFLPRIIAEISAWSAWISEGVSGVPLGSAAGANDWTEAICSLSAIQLGSLGMVETLRQAGAKDSTARHLTRAGSPFFEEMACVMRAQTSKSAPPILGQDLEYVRERVNRAIDIFAGAGLPDALLHGDIGHGNILHSESGSIFLDWAEAGFGNPFLCAEHLLAEHERLFPKCTSDRFAMRRAYANRWRDYANDRMLDAVLAVAPAVAAIAYAIGIWETARLGPDRERAWPLLRALVRRVKRELETSKGRTP